MLKLTRPHGIVVAIDGPSGAGKSTVARLLADRLSYIQIDTGAMYRAAAFLLAEGGIELSDLAAVAAFCGDLEISFELQDGKKLVIANNKNVTDLIRTPEMSLLTSRISALKPVRSALMKAQQRMGDQGGVVLEGRDIGTVVFPDAEVKFFLSASVEERARRRYEELLAKGEAVTLEETISDVAERDRQDTERAIAPLRQADDAVLIDSSLLGIEEVVHNMFSVCQMKLSERVSQQ